MTASHSSVSPADLSKVERQIKTASVLTIVFGLLIALGSHDATDVFVRWFSDVMFLRVGSGVEELTNTNHLADAILGGIMCGWAALMWLLADQFLVVNPRETKRVIITSMAVWFVIDSTGSIASGAWLNAIANVGFLLMFVLPLRVIGGTDAVGRVARTASLGS